MNLEMEMKNVLANENHTDSEKVKMLAKLMVDSEPFKLDLSEEGSAFNMMAFEKAFNELGYSNGDDIDTNGWQLDYFTKYTSEDDSQFAIYIDGGGVYHFRKRRHTPSKMRQHFKRVNFIEHL